MPVASQVTGHAEDHVCTRHGIQLIGPDWVESLSISLAIKEANLKECSVAGPFLTWPFRASEQENTRLSGTGSQEIVHKINVIVLSKVNIFS